MFLGVDLMIYAINAFVVCIALATADKSIKIDRLKYFGIIFLMSIFYSIGFVFKESNKVIFYAVIFFVSYFNYRYAIYRIRDCGWRDTVVFLYIFIPIISLIHIVLLLNKGEENNNENAELENQNIEQNTIKNLNFQNVQLNEIKHTYVNEDDPFEHASIFYPIIKNHYILLNEFDKNLADDFKEELIRNKTFSDSENIHDKYLLHYITMHLNSSDAILYAKNLLENNEIEKLKKLIEISKLLGKSFDLDLVLKKI